MADRNDEPPPIRAWAGILGRATITDLTSGHARLWSVRAEDGRSYVVKATGPWRPGPPLADEYRVLLHVQAAGVPVAPYLVTDDGRLSVEHDGRSLLLLPRLPGGHTGHESGPGGAAVCHAIGRRIGLLHRALAEHPWPVRSYRHDMVEGFRESRDRLPDRLRERAVDGLAGQVLANLDGLPVQRIHGDCGSGNVLVHRGDVSGFIDLDHLPIGPRVYDIAYYLATRIQTGMARRGGRGDSFLSVAGDYVAGYLAANPLSREETAALPSAVLAAELAIAEWSHRLITEMPERALPDQDRRYRRGVAALTWVHDRFPDLTAALSGGATAFRA